MENPNLDSEVDRIYNYLKFKGLNFVYISSIFSFISAVTVSMLFLYSVDSRVALALIVAGIVLRLLSLTLTSVLNTDGSLKFEILPSMNSMDGIPLLFETTETIVSDLQQQDLPNKRRGYQFILSSIFLELIVAATAYIYLQQPFSLYVIGFIILDIFIGLIQLGLIHKYQIQSSETLVEDWRAEYLLNWKITEEDWKKHREDFKRFNTLSINKVEIIRKYLAIARGMNELPSVNRIKELISTFPNQKTLNDALDKGYLDYQSYIAGEQMGCPGAVLYEACVSNGFETYSDFLHAKALGFPDQETMATAFSLGCENFTQYQEMRSHGFEDIQYSEYRKIRSLGFELYSDYKAASESGFPNVKTWLLANIHGIPTYEEMQRMISFGVILDPEYSETGSLIYEEYLQAVEKGFPNYKTYINGGARGFSTYEEMQQAESSGFFTMEEWTQALTLGFTTRDEQNHAKNLGFSSKEEMVNAQKLGCSNKAEYDRLIEEGYRTWDDLLQSHEKGFDSPEHYYAAKRVHAPDPRIYNQIKKGGFESHAQMREAHRLGYFTREEYDEGVSKGAPDAIALEEMDEKGFPNYEVFSIAKKAGFQSFEIYQKATEWGAPDFETFQLMKHGGFTDYGQYKVAVQQGYSDHRSFQEALKFGAKNYKEYLVLRRLNKRRSDYVTEQFAWFSRLQDNYIKVLDAYETLDNLRSRKPNDYYTLEKVVEVLDGIHSSLNYDLNLLQEYDDVFPELRENFTQLKSRMEELFSMVEKDRRLRQKEFLPIREFLFTIQKYNVPAIIPLTNYKTMTENFGITYQELKKLVERYFKEEVSIDLDDMVIEYVQWIASPGEKKKMKEEIQNKLSSLERGSSIGLGKIKEMVEFKGTNRQFEELLNEVLIPDGSLGIVRYDLGTITLPAVDFYKEQYSYDEVKRKIKDQIENAVLNSKVAINIMAISSNISNKPPTPTFRRAIKEVLEDYTELVYNEETGEIIPPVGSIGEECPVCFQKIEGGERVGICPRCKGQTHYNELLPWVLDNKRCPHCQSEISMEDVKSLVA